MEQRCQQEVIELHQFFQGWFNGDLEPDDASFARFAEVIEEDFVLIGPNGKMTARSSLVGRLRGAHGSWKGDGGGRIWIENFRLHRQIGELAVVTYEEWQEHRGEVRGRLSTAIFGQGEDAANGVVWLHLHEVWLPLELRGPR